MTAGQLAGQLPPGSDWIAREFRALRREIEQLRGARRLESATIGAGGLVVEGGAITARDTSGEDVFVVTTDPPGIFMRPELISGLWAQVAGGRLKSDFVAPQEGATTLSYGDLATVGPTVPDVEIVTGVALVWLGAQLETSNTAGGSAVSGDMAFEVRDAEGVVRSPNPDDSLILGSFNIAQEISVFMRTGVPNVVTGLDPGTYTFRAKYRRVQGTAPFNFADRVMVVIGL